MSAHTAIGKLTGLTDREIEQARDSRSSSTKNAAALAFARQVLAGKGQVTDSDFEAVRQEGFGEGEIAEIIAHVALNVFTNYFNLAVATEVDFPKISSRRTA